MSALALLPGTIARPEPKPVERSATRSTVTIEAGRVLVCELRLDDSSLVAVVAERPPDEQAGFVERALRIGLLALQDAGARVNVDLVHREFDGLLDQAAALNERAIGTLEAILRANFADEDGRLPRTLERFLGDRGKLRVFVNDLFDESRRDSAIGRIQTLLGTYFDGDASKLARVLDPTRLGSPLHQFRTEIHDGFARLAERLVAIEAAATARAAERARGTAKGLDFEDLLESLLAPLARGAGDLLERTSADAGSLIRSKKGDFVLTIDPRLTGGGDLRVVIETKDRHVSGPAIRDEIRQAKDNRGAVVGLVVFSSAHALPGCEPFTVVGDDVFCVLDPDGPDAIVLEASVRLVRLLALAHVRHRDAELDPTALRKALEGIREQLDSIRGLKSHLGSIATASQTIGAGLDRLRDAVLARLGEAEAALRSPVIEP